ncbi:hypothetical protein OEB99_19560 [Actinotalea sp. M2MS4P-6]|uniref:hypothetical protein n=1 Tax=Actinotalea sp. M2MS4P-6 TaxID=2983762 RepID=UPI0021E4F7DA|nr:hypothetical protein [Actinotalea sp. M2MS4P-6]MCV2396513.1 hypothetical protein [Actinotalea sp. M2MS4P-6]
MSVDLRGWKEIRRHPEAPEDLKHPQHDGRGPAHASPPAHRSTGGGWGWILQVVTGAALLVLVVVHLVAQHFVVDAPGGLRDYESVLDYLGNPVLLTVEILFLVAVVWHAMLGLRSILLDLGLGATGRRRVTIGVSVLGSATLAYGVGLLVVLVT